MQGVRATHPDYDRLLPRWQRVRDVISGQDAMHAAKERYLAKLKDEEDEDYKARLSRSDFWNATWRTIDALNGMAFRKPPVVTVPKGIEPYLDDITMSGVTLEGFVKECCEEILSPGRIFILVDHPGAPDGTKPITVDSANKMGLRPTLQRYTAESIRNWKFERVNNQWVLTQIILGESAMVQKDEFTAEPEDRYRVLDLLGEGGTYRQRLFHIVDEKDVQIGGDVIPLKNGQPLSFIPGILVGTQGKGDEIDEPPLIDLVDKNVAHYQVNSDYRHGLHTTALPTLFIAGLTLNEGQTIRIGGSAAIVSPEPNAKAEFAEYKGQGLKSVENALDRLEKQMAMLGARMIADETKQQVETLGGTQIKRMGENSVLSKIVQSVSEAVEWALDIFSDWAGASGTVSYQINRDFMPAPMDGRQLLALVTAVQGGVLSHREFFDQMQRGDVIDPDATFEQHLEEIKSQGPTAVPAPVKPGQTA